MKQSAGDHLIQFNVSDLEKATKGFKPSYKIREGEFGAFYKGTLKQSGKKTYVLFNRFKDMYLKPRFVTFYFLAQSSPSSFNIYNFFRLFSFMYTPI